jgi:polysaccharide biosynthesis protein PslH
MSITSEYMRNSSPDGSDRWRILWLTRLDPVQPDAGDLLYTHHLLSSLADAGAEVTVLALARARCMPPRPAVTAASWVLVDPGTDREIRGHVVLRGLLSSLPNVAVGYMTPEFKLALDARLQKDWDAIVVDHLGMGWAWQRVNAYIQSGRPETVSVFVTHQCEGDVRLRVARNYRGNPIRKAALYVDALKARRLEQSIIRESALFSVITSDDRERFGHSEKSVLLPPGYAGDRSIDRKLTSATPRRVLIFGSSLWLAKQMNILEFIDAADRPFADHGVELWVVGKIAEKVRRRQYRATKFFGFIDDPQPLFREVRLGVIPERTGGGFKLKSLDYVFNRVPIAAIRGSVAGLPLAENHDYLSYGSMPELARGILTVIDDLLWLNALQEAAYRKCCGEFDWADRGRALLSAMMNVAFRRTDAPVASAG